MQAPALFLKLGAAVGTASKIFCDILLKVARTFPEVISQYIRVSRFNGHGIRKGAGTYSVSCSTVPPPIVSIVHRGIGQWERCLTFTSILGLLEIAI